MSEAGKSILLGRRRGFTLIEMLIVIAIMSLLTGTFLTVVVYVMRADAEDNIRATLRQEGLGLVRAILHDTQLCRGEGDQRRLLSAPAHPTTQALVLEMRGADKRAARTVAYTRDRAQLKRMIWDGASSTPAVQVLASHVRHWRLERAGGLARIEIELAVNRYEKDFVVKYAFATQIGL